MTSHNGHELLPLKKRYGMNHRTKRVAKAAERAEFRHTVTKAFAAVGDGMGVFDAAIATTYMRGKRAFYLLLLLQVMVVAYLYWQGHR